jgi:hypothetical protein
MPFDAAAGLEGMGPGGGLAGMVSAAGVAGGSAPITVSSIGRSATAVAAAVTGLGDV